MKKPVGWIRLALLCAAVFAVFLIGRSQLTDSLEEARAREASLKVSVTRLQRVEAEKVAELSLVGTSDYIESRARTDYSFLKPGELRFEISNPEALYGYTAEEMQILTEELSY